GVEPGDRVAVQLDNRPEFLSPFFGVPRAGAILVPVNVMYKAEEVDHILTDSGAKVLLSRLPDLANASPDRPPVTMRPGDPSMIQYTSGTTGTPKGAVVSHANIMAAIDTVATLPAYPIHSGSVTLMALPMFHAFGLDLGLGLSLAFGLTMVLVNRFNAELVFSLFEKHRVTLFWGAPPMYYSFVNTTGLDRYDVSSLANCMSGAAPLPAVILERFKEITGVEISEAYGLSETSPILTFNTAGPVNKPGSVGPAYPGIDIAVLDDHDNEVPRGKVGEICARGPVVFLCYWQNEDATREAMRGGWFHTGDLGRADEDGYYYLVDRKKDMINVSGYNVYPIEVENVLLRHPGVRDCAVIGVPDSYQGESVKAVIVAEPGAELTAPGVIEFLRDRLAAFKCPRHVAFVAGLPRSPSGKILKRLLRE
ncbi:MAG: long-chain fatty acid--CoA ligase, partial [bacterium]|nr:long-chain fatty acid--CoA ligase [bacterium]